MLLIKQHTCKVSTLRLHIQKTIELPPFFTSDSTSLFLIPNPDTTNISIFKFCRHMKGECEPSGYYWFFSTSSITSAIKNHMKQLIHFVLFEFQNLISTDLLSSVLSWEQRYIACYSIAPGRSNCTQYIKTHIHLHAYVWMWEAFHQFTVKELQKLVVLAEKKVAARETMDKKKRIFFQRPQFLKSITDLCVHQQFVINTVRSRILKSFY